MFVQTCLINTMGAIVVIFGIVDGSKRWCELTLYFCDTNVSWCKIWARPAVRSTRCDREPSSHLVLFYLVTPYSVSARPGVGIMNVSRLEEQVNPFFWSAWI